MEPSSANNKYSSIRKESEMVDTDVVEAMRKHNQIINADSGTDVNHRWKKFIVLLGKVMDSRPVVYFMIVLTLYSLFSNDVRLSYTHSQQSDDIFEAISSITFFAFVFEISVTAISKYGSYFLLPDTFDRLQNEALWPSIFRRLEIGSFYFWSDVVATLTLLMEMPWVVGVPGPASGSDYNATSTAVRVAARVGRIVRLMRMLRYMNLTYYILWVWNIPSKLVEGCKGAKLVIKPPPSPKVKGGKRDGSPRKSSRRALQESEEREALPTATDATAVSEDGMAVEEYSAAGPSPATANEKDDDIGEIDADSLVGTTMTNLTNKHVIMLVITLLIFIPILSINDLDNSTYIASGLIHAAGLDFQNTAQGSRTAAMQAAVENIILHSADPYLDSAIDAEKTKADIMSVTFSPAIVYTVGGTTVTYNGYTNPKYDNTFMRESESYTIVENSEDGSFSSSITFDIGIIELGQTYQSMYTTIFVVSLLIFGTFFFTREVDRLVIDPIQTMVSLVTQISKNPLGVDYDKELGESDGFFEGMETTILLNTINKIGSLMRVGFGEAGASVIAENLKTSTGGRLNLMTGGRMITSIFGFCDVRQFTDTTECLQEEVMLFVNRIGHILHAIVVQCSGSANKNIGDAFLLTWKLEDDMSQEQIALLADQALLTFCRALIELSTYQDFICNFTAAATERLYKRFPGYLVRIGSGLHVGWAIEGAIGSNRKIDASYLSPHVNFVEFLEMSTKVYGVPLLISEPFFKLLSPHSSKYVRNVDVIRKPGEEKLGLYTYDSDLALNWAELRYHSKARSEKKRNKGQEKDNSKRGRGRKGKIQDEEEKAAAAATSADVEEGGNDESSAGMAKEVAPDIKVAKYKNSVWEKDSELMQLRHMVYTNPEFRTTWDTGIAAYIAGDWPTAEHIFNDTLTMSAGKCGPSKFLLNYIKENGSIAPSDWPGYRMEE